MRVSWRQHRGRPVELTGRLEGPATGAENSTSWQGQLGSSHWLDRQLKRTQNPRQAAVVIAVVSTSITVIAGLLMTVVDHGASRLLVLGSGGPSRRSRPSVMATTFQRPQAARCLRRSSCCSESGSSRSSQRRSRVPSFHGHNSSSRSGGTAPSRRSSSRRSTSGSNESNLLLASCERVACRRPSG